MTSTATGKLPPRGCLMGLDYGSRRVGVAVSDGQRSIASPLAVVANDAALPKHLRSMCDDYSVVGVVVGLPVHMSGDEGEKAQAARAFGAMVSSAVGLTVVYHDERFTTQTAQAAMAEAGLSRGKRKARVDKLAAAFMLQSFLDGGSVEQDPASLR